MSMDDRRKKRHSSTSVDRDDDHRRKKARVPSSTKVGSSNNNNKVGSSNNNKVGSSRVVHIRNISSGVEETDVIQLGLPFGQVSNILMLKMKNQAFLEFERESSAKTMVDYFKNSSPPMICGRTVFVQFSQHRELKTDASHSNANAKTQAALKAARTVLETREKQRNDRSNIENTGRILHLTVENLIYRVTLKTLSLIFQKYGQVERILTFTENNLFQALIEYERARDAEEARHALHGQNIYNGCCNLQIHRSKLPYVDVKQNDDAGWDFTKPNPPSRDDRRLDPERESRSRNLGDRLSATSGTSGVRFKGGSRSRDRQDKRAPLLDAPSPADGRAHKKAKAKDSADNLPEGEEGSVVLVSNLDETQTTPDKLFTLFGVYGNVLRVKILFNKKHIALIQFADASMAETARQHLDKAVVFGKTLSVKTSKHSSVAMPKDDFLPENKNLTKDFTDSPLHRYKKAGSKNCGNIFKPGSTLHLSNISDGLEKEQLVKPFKKFGKVVRFKFFAESQKMAVLAMSSTEEAIDALIHLHNHPFNKNHLRVSFSKSPLKP